MRLAAVSTDVGVIIAVWLVLSVLAVILIVLWLWNSERP